MYVYLLSRLLLFNMFPFQGGKNCLVHFPCLTWDGDGDGQEIEMVRKTEMALETVIVREMNMEMVETEIAEGRWRYRENVHCANKRRGPNSGRL
jgi:hypothetical protein